MTRDLVLVIVNVFGTGNMSLVRDNDIGICICICNCFSGYVIGLALCLLMYAYDARFGSILLFAYMILAICVMYCVL